MTGVVAFAKAIAPAVTVFSQAANIASTVGNLLGSSADEPSYSSLPVAPAAAEPVEAPAVATENTALQADTTTAEEAARQRALRRKKANNQRMTMLNSTDSNSASVLTSTLFGE